MTTTLPDRPAVSKLLDHWVDELGLFLSDGLGISLGHDDFLILLADVRTTLIPAAMDRTKKDALLDLAALRQKRSKAAYVAATLRMPRPYPPNSLENQA